MKFYINNDGQPFSDLFGNLSVMVKDGIWYLGDLSRWPTLYLKKHPSWIFGLYDDLANKGKILEICLPEYTTIEYEWK